jgi:hypothetical protein
LEYVVISFDISAGAVFSWLFPLWDGIFSPRYCIQTGSVSNPTTYPTITGGSVPGDK